MTAFGRSELIQQLTPYDALVTRPPDDDGLLRDQHGYPIEFHDRHGQPVDATGPHGSPAPPLYTHPGRQPGHDQHGRPIHATRHGQPVHVTGRANQPITYTSRPGGGIELSPIAPAGCGGLNILLVILGVAWCAITCPIGLGIGALDILVHKAIWAIEPHSSVVHQLHHFAKDNPRLIGPIYFFTLMAIVLAPPAACAVAVVLRYRSRKRVEAGTAPLL